MQYVDDGDLVRAYGFVAIEFAGLEEHAANRLSQAVPLLDIASEQLKGLRRWPFSRKVRTLSGCLQRKLNEGLPSTVHDQGEVPRALVALNRCLEVAKRRNELMHCAIEANLVDRHIRRRNSPQDKVIIAPEEVYALATQISETSRHIYGMGFTLNRILGLHFLTEFD